MMTYQSKVEVEVLLWLERVVDVQPTQPASY
jgi:hypothetical protein